MPGFRIRRDIELHGRNIEKEKQHDALENYDVLSRTRETRKCAEKKVDSESCGSDSNFRTGAILFPLAKRILFTSKIYYFYVSFLLEIIFLFYSFFL